MIRFLVLIAVIWLVVWLLTALLPIADIGKKIIYAVAGIFCVLLVLQFFGLL